jgi:hypothetical protein
MAERLEAEFGDWIMSQDLQIVDDFGSRAPSPSSVSLTKERMDHQNPTTEVGETCQDCYNIVSVVRGIQGVSCNETSH